MVVIGCLRKVGKAVSVFNQLEATRQNLTQHTLHTKSKLQKVQKLKCDPCSSPMTFTGPKDLKNPQKNNSDMHENSQIWWG